jgi:hypothetical protein
MGSSGHDCFSELLVCARFWASRLPNPFAVHHEGRTLQWELRIIRKVVLEPRFDLAVGHPNSRTTSLRVSATTGRDLTRRYNDHHAQQSETGGRIPVFCRSLTPDNNSLLRLIGGIVFKQPVFQHDVLHLNGFEQHGAFRQQCAQPRASYDLR